MKKSIVALTLSFAICLGMRLTIPTTVYANAAEIQVIFNEVPIEFDTPPQIINGRTMVPVRAIFEALGAQVEWDQDSQTITANREEGYTVRLTVGSTSFYINNEMQSMDIAPQIINGRTLVPVRYVALATGHRVEWDAVSGKVIIEAELENIRSTGQTSDEDRVLSINLLPLIPNRRMSRAELDAWTQAYNESGGYTDFELEVMRLTNIERAAVGVAPLEMDNTLMMSARFKAQIMYDLDYFDHENPVYGGFYVIPRGLFEYRAVNVGENLGKGWRTPDEVVRAWMEAPGHRANILSADYTSIGVGFHGYYWVQQFGG